MTGALAYSPGYQLPLWLGRGQLRLWRRLDATIGASGYTRTTVRELARALGVNPGSVSRDLDRLASLGFAVHDASWGRAGVRLWRVVSRGGRRGLDVKRRYRALRRMGVPSPVPGQLALASVEGRAAHGDLDAWAPPPDPTGAASPPAAPVNPVAEGDRLHDAPGAPAIAPSDADTSEGGPFGLGRCSCGRPRLTRDGTMPPCSHPRSHEPVPAPGDAPTVEPTPSATVGCLDYRAHRADHAYVGGRWVCYACAGEAS